MSSIKRSVLFFSVLALVVGLGVGAIGTWLITDGTRVQHEYYRGLYDACLWFTARYVVGIPDVLGCNSFADDAAGNGWYEEPSPTFDGPSLPVGSPQAPDRVDTARQP